MKPRIAVITLGVDDLEASTRASLAKDNGITPGEADRAAFTLGHNVASTAEVDAVMEQARRAGAVIVKPAQPTFWGGYAGYLQDLDEHLWEVVWNPRLSVPE